MNGGKQLAFINNLSRYKSTFSYLFDENENEHLMLIVEVYCKNRRGWERYTVKVIPIFWNGVK